MATVRCLSVRCRAPKPSDFSLIHSYLPHPLFFKPFKYIKNNTQYFSYNFIKGMSLGLIIQLWITMLTWLLEFILVTLTLRC